MTVSNVELTDDMKIAKIYISFLENKKTVDKLMMILKDKRELIRYYVGLELNLKYIPELRFYHDDTMQYAEKINKIIYKIHHDE